MQARHLLAMPFHMERATPAVAGHQGGIWGAANGGTDKGVLYTALMGLCAVPLLPLRRVGMGAAAAWRRNGDSSLFHLSIIESFKPKRIAST